MPEPVAARGELARRGLESIERAGLDDRRLTREWLYGFLYRALEEAGG